MEISATTEARASKLGGEDGPRTLCPNLHFDVKRSKVKVTGSLSAFFTLLAITRMLLQWELYGLDTR